MEAKLERVVGRLKEEEKNSMKERKDGGKEDVPGFGFSALETNSETSLFTLLFLLRILVPLCATLPRYPLILWENFVVVYLQCH